MRDSSGAGTSSDKGLVEGNVMNSVVTCGSCNRVLDEGPGIPPESRPPCPSCGSTLRGIRISVAAVGSVARLGNVSVNVGVLRNHNLLLQAVVTLGPETHEGQLIEAVAPAWFEIARAIQQNPAIMYEIGYRKWEEMMAAAYKQAGFDEVTLTPSSFDHGRDVIAVKRGFFTVRILEQVKAYSADHIVTANDVRAMSGVLHGDLGATKGIITTTSDFAPRILEDPGLKPFIPNRLELVNHATLLTKLEALLGGFTVRL